MKCTIISICILIIGIIGCARLGPPQVHNFIVETKTVNSKSYTIFRQDLTYVRFTLLRPSREDKHILLAVAGTYTSPHDTVEGFVILDGKIIQAKERQGWDSAVIFKDGSVEIIQTDRGRILTQQKLREIAETGVSLIQAHLLVFRNKAEHFKPQLAYQRRALAVFSDGTIAVIESSTALGLNEFAEDLATLGVRDAINLDMGAWSEGWYRDPKSGEIITIGYPNESTKRQTNWVVFEE